MTIREALTEWLGSGDTPVYFRDSCTGPQCNEECPEEFVQGELTSNNWHLGLKITIAVLIVSVTVLCVVMKFIFGVWLFRLNWKQNSYLDTLDTDEIEAEDKLQVRGMYISCMQLVYTCPSTV